MAASNSSGGPASGLAITLSSTEGTLSAKQGTTNASGALNATITPPTTYAGEAIGVSATVGNQVAALSIIFVPSTFDPTSSARQTRRIHLLASGSTGTTGIIQPFIYAASGPIGSSNPFINPNECFSNQDLVSTVPQYCQTLYGSAGITQKVANVAKTACSAVSTFTGTLDCIGTVLSIGTCLTGAGAAVCVGGLVETAPGCAAFLVPLLPYQFAKNPILDTGLDLLAFGLQPGPPGASDAIGLLCDDLNLADPDTGGTGTTVTVSPQGPLAPLGSPVLFSSSVTGNSDSTVTWSINGVPGASGIFGTITPTGLYTPPATLPIPAFVSIAATSNADSTASAATQVHVLAAAPGTISTIAGDGSSGYSGNGLAANNAQLSGPSGIAFDGPGNMFIADSQNNVIRRVDAVTNDISTIAGNGYAGYSGDGGVGTSARLNNPTHVVFDRVVNLYITDGDNDRIRKINALTDEITTIAGNGFAGYSGDGGLATSAELNFPDGVAIDSNGNLFIGDALNNRVREVTIATGDITTVAGDGAQGYSGDGAPASQVELFFPSRPFIDSAGNIYIADYKNNRVRRVDATTKIITTVAGTGSAGYSGDGGAATSAELNGPISIVVDSAGVLYIADAANERIRAVNTNTNVVTVFGVAIQPGVIQTVVGSGVAGYQGDGGKATSARINGPTGLALDPQGNLIFADSANSVVRKVIAQQ